MKKSALFLLLLTLTCGSADLEDSKTSGFVNGRFWNQLQPMAKVVYLMAFQEGIMAGAGTLDAKTKTTDQYVDPTAAKYGEIVSGLDRLYKQPENINVPVFEALKVLTMKIRGATKDEIENALSECRGPAVNFQGKK
jgi:hypothetical protein